MLLTWSSREIRITRPATLTDASCAVVGSQFVSLVSMTTLPSLSRDAATSAGQTCGCATAVTANASASRNFIAKEKAQPRLRRPLFDVVVRLYILFEFPNERRLRLICMRKLISLLLIVAAFACK